MVAKILEDDFTGANTARSVGNKSPEGNKPELRFLFFFYCIQLVIFDAKFAINK